MKSWFLKLYFVNNNYTVELGEGVTDICWLEITDEVEAEGLIAESMDELVNTCPNGEFVKL